MTRNRAAPFLEYAVSDEAAAYIADALMELALQFEAPKRVKVSDAQLAADNLWRHSFHGGWKYTIPPKSNK